MGYHMAGFEVSGVDITPQPNFPFEFKQYDVMDITDRQINRIRLRYVAIHASPPCQAYSVLNSRQQHIEHPELVEPTRELLDRIGLPYVIENVPHAPLIDPVQLCGSAFGLRVRRHRVFEANWKLEGIDCNHGWQERHKPYLRRISKARGYEMPTGVVSIHGARQMLEMDDELFHAAVAMGIDWMTKNELNQAIPPLYTYYIGRQLKNLL